MRIQTLVFLALCATPSAETAAQAAPATITVRFSIFDLSAAEAKPFAEGVTTGLTADSLLRSVLRPPPGSPRAAYVGEFEVARYSLDARLGRRDSTYKFTLAVIDNRNSQVVAHDSGTVGPGESLAGAATVHARALARAIPR
jgi:hypothetical protein